MFLLFAYCTLATAWAVAADLGHGRTLTLHLGGVSVGDKVVHFAVVGVFALVLARAFRSFGFHRWRSLIAGMAVAAILATLEEATNALTPHRCCSVLDLVADYAGILTVGSVGWLAGFRTQPLGQVTLPTYRPHAYPN